MSTDQVTVLQGAALIALGAFMVWKPRLLWRLGHFMSVKGGEATGVYIFGTRATGVFVIAVGIALIVKFA